MGIEDIRDQLFTEKVLAAVPVGDGITCCARTNADIRHSPHRYHLLRGGNLSPIVKIEPYKENGLILVTLEDMTQIATSWNEPFLYYLASSYEEYCKGWRETIHNAITEKIPRVGG